MSASRAQKVRASVIAGTWYPGNPDSLARTVDDYLARAAFYPLPGEVLGLIAPHAGYAYSGPTAAHAYRQLQGQTVDTVVVIGPSHRAWVGDYAASGEDAYETPLGLVPLDRAFIDALGDRLPLKRVERDAEHALEIQLPFLQRQLSTFRLVPIMMSADDPLAAHHLAAALAETAGPLRDEGRRVLFVASSDLHHVDDYREVLARDEGVVGAVAAYDLKAIEERLMDRHSSVCGRMPILAVLRAAHLLGANVTRVLHYTNSAEVSGERRPGQYTVGYMAAAVYRQD